MSAKVVIAIVGSKPQLFSYNEKYWKDINIPHIICDYDQLSALNLEISSLIVEEPALDLADLEKECAKETLRPEKDDFDAAFEECFNFTANA